jgi:hypothetical protein
MVEEASPLDPVQPRPPGRAAELLRSCGRALAASKLNRAALLALVLGLGLGGYSAATDGSHELQQGGWTAALTSLSILAAYAIGFLIRRALRLALLVAGAAAGALAILKVSGVDLSLSDIAGYLSAKAGELEGWVESWLPSGAGAATGLFFGLRRGKRDD